MRPRRGTITDRTLLGEVTVATAIIVLVILQVRTAGLGPDPARGWDCNISCTDLWADARSHYARTSYLAAAAAVLGWTLIGTSRPARSSCPRRFRWPMVLVALVAVLLINTAQALSELPLFVLGQPALVLGNLTATLLTAVLSWWVLRRCSHGDAWSWWVSGAIVVAGAVAFWAVLGLAVQASAPIPIFVGFLAPGIVDVGALLVLVLQRRAATQETTRPDPGAIATSAPGSTSESDTTPRRHRSTLLSAALAVAVIGLGLWAARPVDAPPQDATELSVAIASQQASPAPTPAHTPSGTLPPLEPSVVPPPSDWRVCDGADLAMTAEGWESAAGDSYAVLVATNTSDTPCVLSDAPLLAVSQGGTDLHLAQQPLERSRFTSTPPASGVGLPKGASAQAYLFWHGYRNAADQTTPQVLTARVQQGDEAVPVAFDGDAESELRAAPFDLVDGGAIEVGRWEQRTG